MSTSPREDSAPVAKVAPPDNRKKFIIGGAVAASALLLACCCGIGGTFAVGWILPRSPEKQATAQKVDTPEAKPIAQNPAAKNVLGLPVIAASDAPPVAKFLNEIYQAPKGKRLCFVNEFQFVGPEFGRRFEFVVTKVFGDDEALVRLGFKGPGIPVGDTGGIVVLTSNVDAKRMYRNLVITLHDVYEVQDEAERDGKKYRHWKRVALVDVKK